MTFYDDIVKHPSFALIDPIIFEWVKKNKLSIHTDCRKEEEMRMVIIKDTKGDRFQIDFGIPINNEVKVYAWNCKSKPHNQLLKEWNVKITDLEPILEEALETVKRWMYQPEVTQAKHTYLTKKLKKTKID